MSESEKNFFMTELRYQIEDIANKLSDQDLEAIRSLSAKDFQNTIVDALKIKGAVLASHRISPAGEDISISTSSFSAKENILNRLEKAKISFRSISEDRLNGIFDTLNLKAPKQVLKARILPLTSLGFKYKAQYGDLFRRINDMPDFVPCPLDSAFEFITTHYDRDPNEVVIFLNPSNIKNEEKKGSVIVIRHRENNLGLNKYQTTLEVESFEDVQTIDASIKIVLCHK